MENTQFTPVVASATGKVYKVPNRLGRGIPGVKDNYTKKCSCIRDKTIVFCRACGYYCNGRIRLKCEMHPHVTFLLDIAECPRCHSSLFLDEYFESVQCPAAGSRLELSCLQCRILGLECVNTY